MTDRTGRTWTYGAEHELADWDRTRGLPTEPPGWAVDERDVTMMNSDGSAVDPRGVINTRGGEVNTPPTATPEGQGLMLATFLLMHPESRVNHRSNLHIHVRVPGLRDDLDALKEVQAYCDAFLERALALVEPIRRPTSDQYASSEEYNGALRRWRRRLVSHHTRVPAKRVEAQLRADTVQEFFEAECVRDRHGRVMWHAQPRAAVNLRQMWKETNTVEFRHFPGTLQPSEVVTCARWCRAFLLDALNTRRGPEAIFHEGFAQAKFPQFPPYVHWMEVRYRATVLDGTVPRDVVRGNLERIREGTFQP